MNGDSRGWRVALVPDAIVNPIDPKPHWDVMAVTEACGYGLLQLPPPGKEALLLAVIADQVAEYAHHGYAVVAIGLRGGVADGLHWRRLAPLLRGRTVALPPRHVIRPDVDLGIESARLKEFLTGYDLPAEERRRWRG